MLAGGTDQTVQDADVINAMSMFADPTQSAISLLMTGPFTSLAVQSYAVNLAGTRKDCVAFISPPQATVVNNAGSEQLSTLAWMAALSSITGGVVGSYGFADSGWKYMFDRYNNTYRWVPVNGDIAGLCVYTDTQNNPWWMGKNPTEREQAEWVKKVYTELLKDKNVEKTFWAFFRDCSGHWGTGVDYFGLVRWDYSRKPSFKSYRDCFNKWKKNK